jgi:hypothetical protein
MRSVAIAVAAVLAVACGGATSSATVVDTTPGGSAPGWRSDVEHPLAEDMRELAGQMRKEGLEVGGLEGRGFLAMRQSATFRLRIPASRCLTVVALTSSGLSDLDATLYTPGGDVLAEDVQPDAHPTVQVCGGEQGRRLYYHVRAYEGAGAYLFAAFEGDRSSFEAAARVIGGRPGVAASHGTAASADPQVRELAGGLQRRGFERLGDPQDVPLSEGQHVRIPLKVEASHCYTVGAFGHGSISELHVQVFDELGEEVARDMSGGAEAAAQLCTERKASYSVELHAVAGKGHARVALFEGGASAVGGRSGLWLGQHRAALRSETPLGQTLERELGTARELGYGKARERVRGELHPSEAVAHRFEVAKGHCTMVLVTGGKGIGRLVLRVLAAEGTVLGTRDATEPRAAVRLCAGDGKAVRAQVIARGGGGPYALHTLRKQAPEWLPEHASALERGAVLDARERAERGGWRLLSEVQRVKLPHRVQIEPGEGCRRVDAVAKGKGGTLDLRLGHGRDLLDREGGRSASVHTCARDRALTVEAQGHGKTDEAYLLRFGQKP